MMAEKLGTLKNDVVELSPLTEDDADDLVLALSDERMAEHLDYAGPHYNEHHAKFFIRQIAPAQRKSGDGVWAIRPLEDGEAGPLVGLAILRDLGETYWNIGYWVRPDEWNKGYATAAAELILDAAFNQLGATRVQHVSKVGNGAARKIARNLGFKQEGTIRVETPDGEPSKRWQFGVLPSDWNGRSDTEGQGRVDPKVLLGSAPAELVSEFHQVYEMPNKVLTREEPTLDIERLPMRMALIKEEMVELVGAVYGEAAESMLQNAFESLPDEENRDLVETADALADLVYVIYGMALETGIDLDAVLAEVQSSNLSKLDADGSVIRRADGKILKGPNFQEPRIAEVLNQS